MKTKHEEFVDKVIQEQIRDMYLQVYQQGFVVGFFTALTGAIVFFYITTGA